VAGNNFLKCLKKVSIFPEQKQWKKGLNKGGYFVSFLHQENNEKALMDVLEIKNRIDAIQKSVLLTEIYFN